MSTDQVMESSMSSATSMAFRNWQMANNVESLETIYQYDSAEQQAIRAEIKIAALALLKMVMHARSGGNLEVMGLVQGKVDANTLVVVDSFALPVEGTETRVNAQAQAYEYMTTYTDSSEAVGRLHKVVGWYHSHPGYGCWLSGIDVSTQALNQQFQEPFVAIVVDPIRTMSAGKVELGAFRTYPKGYKPPDEVPSEYQSIPLNKIEDFGVHCKQYYPLEVSYFKSALDSRLLDSLWNTYWVSTLSSNSLITNSSYITSQINDLAQKLQNVSKCKSVQGTRSLDSTIADKLSKIIKDTKKIVLMKQTLGEIRKIDLACKMHSDISVLELIVLSVDFNTLTITSELPDM
uniref:COP9 signalosome complex subunit 5 n=1 Tax=Setaria digitata TaxID=48799 RepID=A0A915PDK9_9BILA